MGVASGWNLWVWLECMDVVSGCCIKEVYRFPHITYPYFTCISSFVAAASLLLCSFLKCFLFLIYLRTLFKCVVKCLRFQEKREIASLIFAFARGFTWFASGSLIYCVLLNEIVEKTHNSQLLGSRI